MAWRAPVPPLVGRRALLAGGFLFAAGLAGTGCRRRAARAVSRPSRPSPAASSATGPPPVGLYFATPIPQATQAALAQGVAVAVPGISLQPGAVVRGETPSWWFECSAPPVVGAPVDLGPGLRAVNFDPAVLVPGAQNIPGFVQRPGQIAMPVGLAPMAVDWNPAALEAAGIGALPAAWTLDQFEATCALLEAAIAAGKLQAAGVSQVLYPLQGTPAGGFEYDPATGAEWSVVTAELATAPLWEAFIQGFGGTVAGPGGIRWDQGAALVGVQRLIDLFRRFGSGPAPALTQAALGAAWKASAMRIVHVYQFLAPPQAEARRVPGLAPFPTLPARPVLPATAQAGYLEWSPGGPGQGVGPPPRALAPTQAEAVLTAARYLAWQYQDAQQRLFVEGGVAPVTVGGLRHADYWTALGLGTAADLVFPYPWSVAAEAVLRSGLASVGRQALADPGSLQDALRTLSGRLTAAEAAAP